MVGTKAFSKQKGIRKTALRRFQQVIDGNQVPFQEPPQQVLLGQDATEAKRAEDVMKEYAEFMSEFDGWEGCSRCISL